LTVAHVSGSSSGTATAATTGAGATALQNLVLLDDHLSPAGASYLFREPIDIICAMSADEAPAALASIEHASRQGHYVAGHFAYELGYLVEDRLAGLMPQARSGPLIWMAVYERAHAMTGPETDAWLAAHDAGGFELGEITPTRDRNSYAALFDRAQRYIAAGDIYQVNLTFKGAFNFSGDPISLYRTLRRRQHVAFGGMILTPHMNLLSLSPELFVRITNGVIESRPMKGTAARADTAEADAAQKRWLHTDEKSRAENLMILDLMRNDIGRIAQIGSVEVTDMFTIETFATLHQMTSGVRAKLKPGTGLPQILRALFPCGSITGAPKIRAMEIIAELEDEARGAYCGAIGMIAPGGDMCFNVAIRTVALAPDGTGQIGIGGGLVADSQAGAEYDEALLKMQFLAT